MQSIPEIFRNISCMGLCVNGSRDQNSGKSVLWISQLENAGTAVVWMKAVILQGQKKLSHGASKSITRLRWWRIIIILLVNGCHANVFDVYMYIRPCPVLFTSIEFYESWQSKVLHYRHLLDSTLPHLFWHCHCMCKKVQDGNVPEFSCMSK